jgi:hypothetical protein
MHDAARLTASISMARGADLLSRAWCLAQAHHHIGIARHSLRARQYGTESSCTWHACMVHGMMRAMTQGTEALLTLSST